MAEIHICAECTDFIGGGDWGLCCKSMEYNDLCYAHTEACERFKPGRRIDPVVLYTTPDGEPRGRKFTVDATFAEYVSLAKQVIAEGNADVRIVNVVDIDGAEHRQFLWDERHGVEVDA